MRVAVEPIFFVTEARVEQNVNQNSLSPPQIDLSNAFNMVSRRAILLKTERFRSPSAHRSPTAMKIRRIP